MKLTIGAEPLRNGPIKASRALLQMFESRVLTGSLRFTKLGIESVWLIAQEELYAIKGSFQCGVQKWWCLHATSSAHHIATSICPILSESHFVLACSNVFEEKKHKHSPLFTVNGETLVKAWLFFDCNATLFNKVVERNTSTSSFDD